MVRTLKTPAKSRAQANIIQFLVKADADPNARDADGATDETQDIPYGEDWHSADEVNAWSVAADNKRPWRSQFRDAIAQHIARLSPQARVLELGSGPGYLAEHVLERCPELASYTLLDFSEPMLALSRLRLSRFPRAALVQADFRTDAWVEALSEPFDCVVSMQAIHEARHKQHATGLYQRVHRSLGAKGSVLICDHTPLDDSPRSAALYMTESEQVQSLTAAGFVDVEVALSISKLVLYVARKDPRT